MKGKQDVQGGKSVSISKLRSHLPMKVTEAANELGRAPGPVAGSCPLPTTSHKEHWGSSPRSRKLSAPAGACECCQVPVLSVFGEALQ